MRGEYLIHLELFLCSFYHIGTFNWFNVFFCPTERWIHSNWLDVLLLLLLVDSICVTCSIIYTFENSVCTKCHRWRHLFLSHQDPKHSSFDGPLWCPFDLIVQAFHFECKVCAILHWIFGWTTTIHMEMLFCDTIRETPLNAHKQYTYTIAAWCLKAAMHDLMIRRSRSLKCLHCLCRRRHWSNSCVLSPSSSPVLILNWVFVTYSWNIPS